MNKYVEELNARKEIFNQFLIDLITHYQKGEYKQIYDYTAHVGHHDFNKKNLQQMNDLNMIKTQSLEAIAIESKITGNQHQVSKNLIKSYNFSPENIKIETTTTTINIPLYHQSTL